MNKTLLVAKREFLQIAKTRSFWLTLLIFPAMLMLAPLIATMVKQPAPIGYILADPSGRFGANIEQRLHRAHQREVLADFALYAQRWGLKPKSGEAPWTGGRQSFSDAEVDAFIATGGVKGALADIGPLPERTPRFVADPRQSFLAPIPPDVPTDKGAEAFGKAAARYLSGAKGVRPLRAAVYIPADFGAPGVAAKVWTNGGSSFVGEQVRDELSHAVRMELGRKAGLTEADAGRLETASATVDEIAPPRGQGRERLRLQSGLPLIMSYLLLMSLFISGAWLLQGVLEEKSNKLLEAVLACISPAELMHGKLIGIVGVGFTVIAVWISCVLGVAFSLSGGLAEAIRPALAALNSPILPLALIFYFIAGYLILSMIYLTIGALSESMQDAQAYMAPLSLGLFLPFTVLSQLINNPDAMAAKVLSWIPIYTPFAMMARMGVGVAPYELIGTSLLLVAFIAVEFLLLGRVFQVSLLRIGQPPRIGEFIKLMFARADK